MMIVNIMIMVILNTNQFNFMLKNHYKDFFIYNKKHHWYIIPAVIFYYDKESYYDDGKTSPSWGLTIRWLTYMIGFQIQKINENRD
mgnify:FL=1|jgi:hypothetical protein